MSDTLLLPTLGGGYIKDRNVIVNKLFEYFLAANENQSNYALVESGKYIMGLPDLTDYDRGRELEKSLERLYEPYFDSVNAMVSHKKYKTNIDYVIKIEAIYEGRKFTLDPDLNNLLTDVNRFENMLLKVGE